MEEIKNNFEMLFDERNEQRKRIKRIELFNLVKFNMYALTTIYILFSFWLNSFAAPLIWVKNTMFGEPMERVFFTGLVATYVLFVWMFREDIKRH